LLINITEISVGIDFTARDLQTKLKAKGLPWEKAKAFDGSAVIGDFLQKSNLVLENLTFELTNNGETVQVSDSSYMLWKIDELILCFSVFYAENRRYYFTGTPAGCCRKTGRHIGGILEGQKLFRIQVK
jgi:2-keto-4-pentenoate hydratase/2-oxohepta-3-ene-1,7-dioic acid hydratase in catechol pathway